jgi:predicted RND superfamily exporter protein
MPGLELHATAETILTTRAANVLSLNMLQDLGVTIVIVGIVCSLFFMSLRAGLLSLIPNVLPVAIGFGTLGLFGVPINVGTSLIAAIAIGIAIDDTVHYMARNAMELDRHHDTEIAMAETVRPKGRRSSPPRSRSRAGSSCSSSRRSCRSSTSAPYRRSRCSSRSWPT